MCLDSVASHVVCFLVDPFLAGHAEEHDHVQDKDDDSDPNQEGCSRIRLVILSLINFVHDRDHGRIPKN